MHRLPYIYVPSLLPTTLFASKLWDLSCNPICVCRMQQIRREIRGYSSALKITVIVVANEELCAALVDVSVHPTLMCTRFFPYLGVLIWLPLNRKLPRVWLGRPPVWGSPLCVNLPGPPRYPSCDLAPLCEPLRSTAPSLGDREVH